ncbi:MAG: hypothetical protein QOK43_3380 [Acidimicrobiaceae bacterium]|nr:hypothetical protein [Acidimicrobiaceae bacterium]
MTLVVDDQLLSLILRGGRLPGQLDSSGPIFTTGQWYVRLCQAALGVADRPGTLSGPFAALPPHRRAQALAAVLELPDEIGLISLRELAPVIAQLRARHQLNILSIEAVAAAVQLGATVALSTMSPRLEAALAAEGRPVEIVA